MRFVDAWAELLAGKKIRRQVWQGRGLWIKMGKKRMICNYFGQQFNYILFVDLLANDWEVVT